MTAYEARFEGEQVTLSTPQDGTRLGIATVYQDLALADNLDVVQNLFLGAEETRGGLLDEVDMEKRSLELLAQLRVQDAEERAHRGRARCRAASGSRSRSPARCWAIRRS